MYNDILNTIICFVMLISLKGLSGIINIVVFYRHCKFFPALSPFQRSSDSNGMIAWVFN